MNEKLKILMLEDNEADAEMIQRLLRKRFTDCSIKKEMTEDAFITALNEFEPDIVISDNEMPQFCASEALSILHHRTKLIPFILVTGTVSEEFAVDIIKSGADDYILKDRLARLPAAIDVALKQKKTEKDKLEAAEKLQEEKDKFSKIAAISPGLIYSMRLDGGGKYSFPYTSEAITDIYGFSASEIKDDAQKIFSLIHQDDIAGLMKKIINAKQKLVPLVGEYRYLHPLKGIVWHEMNSLPVPEPEGAVVCHGVITDITERKIAEKKILKANRLYSFISQINQMIIRIANEQELYEGVCRIAVNAGEFSFAWIGIADETAKILVPVMKAGRNSNNLQNINPIAIDADAGQMKPTAKAWKDGKYYICNDIENDASMQPWKEELLSKQYYSLMALPIKKFGRVTGIFTVYAPEKYFFDAGEIVLLEEATNDISFALEFLENELLRKKAEEAVIASEERYHRLTEVAPVGIYHTDTTGCITYVNHNWCMISGISMQQALGTGWLNAVHPDDRKALEGGCHAGTIITKLSISEYRFVHPDGEVIWVMGKAIPELNTANETAGYVGTITDITTRKKAEESILISNERYNLVSKATNDAIWDFDIVSGIITRAGDGFNLLFGYNNSVKMAEKPNWIQLIHPDYLAVVEQSMEDVFSNPKEFYWEQEYLFLKADGSYAFVYDKGYIIRDSAGLAVRMIGAMKDITRQKENEIHLKELNESLLLKAKELTESNAELEQFAYVASHDLQEPLRMVTSFLSLLENRYDSLIDEDGKKYIHYAVDGASRMRKIILDLLEFSRVGRNIGDTNMLDVNNLVKEVELMLLKQVQENGASIQVKKLPVIKSYETLIRQVFQNLISNALSYSRLGVPAIIKISSTELAEHWQFIVEDNGIGIEMEFYDKIFIIFQRLHPKDESSGTGIGLSITKKIVEALGGEIWLTSKAGTGTTFYFTIRK